MKNESSTQSLSLPISGFSRKESAATTPQPALPLFLNKLPVTNKKNQLTQKEIAELFYIHNDFLVRKSNNRPVTYFQIGIAYETYYTARLLWALASGFWPKHPMQFLDGNKYNVCLSNLFQPPVERLDTCSQEQMQELFSYDADSGAFQHKELLTAKTIIGAEVGYRECTGYRKFTLNDKDYPIANLIWSYVYGYYPPVLVDHINHVRDDNRLENLRHATHVQNCRNMSLSANNTSGRCGIGYHAPTQKWRVTILGEHKGLFSTFEEAITVRESAEKELGFHPNHGKEQ